MNFDEWLTIANMLKQVLSYAHLFTVYASLHKTGFGPTYALGDKFEDELTVSCVGPWASSLLSDAHLCIRRQV